MKRDDDDVLYAGGEKSGMAIQNRDDITDHLVRGIIEQAQRSPHILDDECESDGKIKPFQGKGQKLSGATFPSPVATTSKTAKRPSKAVRKLTLWKDGFTVNDDGPLYDYKKPENQQILAMLQSGQAPLQLLQVEPGQPVDVRVAHRIDENFKPGRIKSKSQSFSGKGHRLGDMDEPPSVAKTAIPSPAKAVNMAQNIDPTLPTTNLQIRFTDGRRTNATFNTTNTIADLYNYVRGLEGGGPSFVLLAGRPPVKLDSDDSQSLEQAGLLNSLITQQLQ